MCQVNKKPGKEHEDLLSEDEPNLGLWDSISRLSAFTVDVLYYLMSFVDHWHTHECCFVSSSFSLTL